MAVGIVIGPANDYTSLVLRSAWTLSTGGDYQGRCRYGRLSRSSSAKTRLRGAGLARSWLPAVRQRLERQSAARSARAIMPLHKNLLDRSELSCFAGKYGCYRTTHVLTGKKLALATVSFQEHSKNDPSKRQVPS